jgi:hypothetical protein
MFPTQSETILSNPDSPKLSGSDRIRIHKNRLNGYRYMKGKNAMKKKKSTLTFRFYELFLLWLGQGFTQLTEQRNLALWCVYQ